MANDFTFKGTTILASGNQGLANSGTSTASIQGKNLQDRMPVKVTDSSQGLTWNGNTANTSSDGTSSSVALNLSGSHHRPLDEVDSVSVTIGNPPTQSASANVTVGPPKPSRGKPANAGYKGS